MDDDNDDSMWPVLLPGVAVIAIAVSVTSGWWLKFLFGVVTDLALFFTLPALVVCLMVKAIASAWDRGVPSDG